MSTNNKQEPSACGSEQHHGDLRKGAFLRRRAVYQMQAGSRSPAQTGATSVKRKNGA